MLIEANLKVIIYKIFTASFYNFFNVGITKLFLAITGKTALTSKYQSHHFLLVSGDNKYKNVSLEIQIFKVHC